MGDLPSPDVGRVAAVDVGGTRIKIGVVAPSAGPETVVDGAQTRTAPVEMEQTLRLIEREITKAGPVSAVGLGLAGIVDAKRGTWRWSPHTSGRDIEVGPRLSASLGVPVAVDNDANMAVIAEARLGAGVGHRSVLLITLGTGIGGALVIGGKVERGRGALGELGHMRVAATPECVCGGTGCWEALVSGRVLDAVADRVLGSGRSAQDLVAAAEEGGTSAARELAEIGRWLGVGLGNLVAALDPDVIVFGGGAGPAVPALLATAREAALEARSGLRVAGLPPLMPARFGGLAGLVGAVIAARGMEP